MGTNIPDIMHTIQFKISDFITILELFQWLGQVGKNKSRTTIAMTFSSKSSFNGRFAYTKV